jgi:hypothetical protein
MRALWENAPGKEYDLLRLLPPDEAGKVWKQAFHKGGSRLFQTWWGWLLLFLVSLPLTLTAIFVWIFAALLGGGLLGRIAAEVLVHVLLAVALHRLMKRLLPTLLRPFVWEELLLLEQELSPSREAVAHRAAVKQ